MTRPEATAAIEASLRSGAEHRNLLAVHSREIIAEAATLLATCLQGGGKLLFCGNGGSAADAQHLAAEFVGRFVLERQALPAIALTTDTSILTAVGNDYGFEQVFARQVAGLGSRGDVVVGISTSGNSPNVIAAIKVAKERGLKSIELLGKDGGALAELVDISIVVGSSNTSRIQECHIAIGHIFCELVEGDLPLEKS